MTAPQQTGASGEQRAFLRPAGFSTFAGERIGDGQRLRSLTSVFVRNLAHGLGRKLALAASLLPALGMSGYALLRAWLGDQAAAAEGGSFWAALAVSPDQQATFLVDNTRLLFGLEVAWLLLFQVALVAPLIARDIRQGALILYFSRPVRRGQYLQARLAAAAGVGAMALVGAGWLTLLAHLVGFGWQLPGTVFGTSGWLVWPALFAGVALAALFISSASTLLALACGALMKNPSAAGLVLGGGLLGSVGISWVLQLVWGRNSLARAFDLHHALVAPMRFATMAVDAADAPDFAVLDAATGVGLWLLLAVIGWLILARFMANPPLGRGRT